jgi:succinate dehydrogenase assembly factor 1
MPGKLHFSGGILPSNAGYRAEFQKHLSVNKKDFSAVEYLLRKGHRQLEMYASPGIRNIR